MSQDFDRLELWPAIVAEITDLALADHRAGHGKMRTGRWLVQRLGLDRYRNGHLRLLTYVYRQARWTLEWTEST